MMSRMNPLKHVWIWCKRFRHRCGYGVHSPFAFNLITWVIYEKAPFYAYRELDEVRKSPLLKGKDTNTKKVDRLLFRLVNEVQPKNILEVGTQAGVSALYLSAAKKDAAVVTLDTEQAVSAYLKTVSCADFVHFDSRKPEYRCFEQLLPKTDAHSLFIIEGIYDSKEMKEWWRKLVADERTGITFDLYELGLIFFDKTKIKQHYIVNF